MKDTPDGDLPTRIAIDAAETDTGVRRRMLDLLKRERDALGSGDLDRAARLHVERRLLHARWVRERAKKPEPPTQE